MILFNFLFNKKLILKIHYKYKYKYNATKMDTNKANKFVYGTPTSAFTPYSREPSQNPNEIIQTQRELIKKRKSTFAHIKRLFRLKMSDDNSI
jgi:hypothetical protein